MQSLKEVMKNNFPFQQAGEKECEACGTVYKLYQTPKGVQGACKPCADKQFKKEMNLPTVEEYRNNKEMNFILSFERVTDDLKNATVNSYKDVHKTQKEAKQAAVDFITGFDGAHSLALSGDPGLGKSHLAYAINKAIRSKGYKTLYIKATDLLERIRSTYSSHSSITEEQILSMIDGLDLLVLDDIGSEYVKSNESGHETWASDILYKVFDMRLNKSTVCTTNYFESELEAKYGNNGPRIIDRMMDMATAIRLEGESYRRKERF
ncbi:ATP-binding protein [Virgibacillus halodenitrificans]|uniref:ATP-binding protein n=1 Tax=Virgibacillus halodenitrificans TaxID=1482 RepID=UPI001FB4741F|nr:ATP-binding protein [Virgibacillus halodenitrificans]MCJ0932952.1 ATP-binding protein [Virgibacillus halodenitrificans]